MSETETHGIVAGETPLDAILGSGPAEVVTPDAPSQEPAAHGSDRDGDDEPQVSLLALHRERERRQKMDARVKELEEELQRFNEQKWGLEQEQGNLPAAGNLEAASKLTHAQQKEWDQRAFAYNQGYAKFVADHGKAKVAAIDAAINSLSPQQKAHAIALASEGGVERVHEYVQQLGVLEEAFKPKSLGDVLSGKMAEPKPTVTDVTVANLDARERAIFAAERNTAFNASRAEFVSEFGRSGFEKLDAASKSLLESGHPVAAEFARAVTAHDNPVAAAAQILNRLGLWAPEQAAPQRQASAMPSNFSTARSVNSRNGPAFAGPTPLTDIFKR